MNSSLHIQAPSQSSVPVVSSIDSYNPIPKLLRRISSRRTMEQTSKERKKKKRLRHMWSDMVKLRGSQRTFLERREFLQLLDLLLVKTKLKYLSWMCKATRSSVYRFFEETLADR